MLLRSNHSEEPTIQAVKTIVLDIAKSVFQVQRVDAEGQVVVRQQLKRRYVLAFFQKQQPCSRELQALGHTVRLMPPAHVKPYVKRRKNDASDREAIYEAVGRTNMSLWWHQDARAAELPLASARFGFEFAM